MGGRLIMAHTTQRERIEMRVSPEIKLLAERAAAVCGYASMTEFITNLIRKNAPRILQQETAIRLANEHFDHFITACEDTERKPSPRLVQAAKRLDAEGF